MITPRPNCAPQWGRSAPRCTSCGRFARYIAGAGQSGLGLPNRDYYLLEGEKYDTFRKGYRDYAVRLHQLAGIADAEQFYLRDVLRARGGVGSA